MVESHHLLAGLQSAARLADLLLTREKQKLAPPAGIEPAFPDRQSDVLAAGRWRLPLDDQPIKIAGEGIAPPYKAYEAWLDLSPV